MDKLTDGSHITDGSPYVPQVPIYLKTHIIIIIYLYNTSVLNFTIVCQNRSPIGLVFIVTICDGK